MVTFLAPMKRGLKANDISSDRAFIIGNIPCPDEKGTERLLLGMVGFQTCCNIPCPDEKGTERRFRCGTRKDYSGNIPCPDEKGTERFISTLERYGRRLSNIPCPDEKGTERE